MSYHCNPVLSVFFLFNVAVIFKNVKTYFFGLSILMAYVNCKGHHFILMYKMTLNVCLTLSAQPISVIKAV